MLLIQQRQVNRSLREAMQNTRKHIIGRSNENGTSTYVLVEDDGSGYTSAKATKDLEVSLMVINKFNTAAIRIALYPCAPIAWWFINLSYYVIQYPLTMTYQADVATFVHMSSLAWFSMPAVVFANFLVFVTDPALRKAIKEVQKSVLGPASVPANKLNAASSQRRPEYSHDTIYSDHATLCRPETAIYTKKLSNTAPSIDKSSLESIFEHSGQNGTESIDPSVRSTAVLNAYNKLIRRHPTVGSGVDANMVYSKM
ncbi:hypothetical protein IWW37_001902 [Coemansia sp. RSA 2050]|nr:hypothetical protein IWW37_001902 [Coemansia sp. RSA 2050]KAJ2734738.1 hypothetical protein IW152_002061 [Coemansia sp. BCRC 34962]